MVSKPFLVVYNNIDWYKQNVIVTLGNYSFFLFHVGQVNNFSFWRIAFNDLKLIFND